jgi:hypothetical protein
VAVDETCRDRLIYENGIPADRVRVLLNFVDLKRFKPRGPLPNKPKRALVFSNGTNEHDTLPAIREACARFDITVDAVGQGVGNPTAQPENLLANYDLVFAKARAALEALAVGASVIACDTVGAGPLVTPLNMAALRQLNFGIRALRHRIDVEHIAGEIARYDAHQAAEVTAWVRNNAGMDAAVDQLVKLYQEVIEEHRQSGGTNTRLEMQAAAEYLRQWVPNLTRPHQATLQMCREADVLLTRNARLNTDLSAALVNLAELHGSSAMRLRNRLVSVPFIGRWVKSLARVAAASFGNEHLPKKEEWKGTKS